MSPWGARTEQLYTIPKPRTLPAPPGYLLGAGQRKTVENPYAPDPAALARLRRRAAVRRSWYALGTALAVILPVLVGLVVR
jgi:hypothetical protein